MIAHIVTHPFLTAALSALVVMLYGYTGYRGLYRYRYCNRLPMDSYLYNTTAVVIFILLWPAVILISFCMAAWLD